MIYKTKSKSFTGTARLTRQTAFVLRIHIIICVFILLFVYSYYCLRIHIIDLVGKSKQVIMNHTHHAGGVTDIVGLSIQVILYHTHHAEGPQTL